MDKNSFFNTFWSYVSTDTGFSLILNVFYIFFYYELIWPNPFIWWSIKIKKASLIPIFQFCCYIFHNNKLSCFLIFTNESWYFFLLHSDWLKWFLLESSRSTQNSIPESTSTTSSMVALKINVNSHARLFRHRNVNF